MSIFGFNNEGLKRGASRYGNSDSWDESKHPRAEDGKFGKGGGGDGSGGGDKGGDKGGDNVVPIKKPLKKDDWFAAVKDTKPYMWDRSSPEKIVMFFRDKKEGKQAAEKLKSLGGKPTALKYDGQSGKYVMFVKEPEFSGESKDEQARIKKEAKEHKARKKAESGPDQRDFDRMDRKGDIEGRSKASQRAKAKKERKPLSKEISVTPEEKKLGQQFIMKTLDPGATVPVSNPVEHKIAERLVAEGVAEIVGKKNYGRIEKIKIK